MTREVYDKYQLELHFQDYLKSKIKEIKSSFTWSDWGSSTSIKEDMSLILETLESAIERSKERQKKL